LLIALPALLAASGPRPSQAEPIDLALKRAQAEARSAEAEQQRLEQAAERARGQAERLQAEQAAAAQSIAAAEARISAADARQRLAAAQLTLMRTRFERQQQPVASLLAGLAMMARRPPLLAIADGASTDELIRVRLLLDATLPAIRKRTAALSGELGRLEQLELASASARTQLIRRRAELQDRQRAFAALEARALSSEAMIRGGSLAAGDAALAAAENADLLSGRAGRDRGAASVARDLAALGPAPLPRSAARAVAELRYRLPADAPVVQGFGAISDSGVRSRGVTFATRRGSAVQVPADGIIRFAGPFRDYDGIVIIDHGGGWMSLIVNAASPLARGSRGALRPTARPRARAHRSRIVEQGAPNVPCSHRRFISFSVK
jgi:septal ring factor EnvC (AmiA/AmiB activator)